MTTSICKKYRHSAELKRLRNEKERGKTLKWTQIDEVIKDIRYNNYNVERYTKRYMKRSRQGTVISKFIEWLIILGEDDYKLNI